MSWPRITHRTYPEPVHRYMSSVIVPYVKKSMAVNMTFLAFFERRLGLPSGALLGRHRPNEQNGGEARCIRTPPYQTTAGIGAHTDFGSLVSLRILNVWLMKSRICLQAIVHNRLGGLQVLPPGHEKWLYVKVLFGPNSGGPRVTDCAGSPSLDTPFVTSVMLSQSLAEVCCGRTCTE